MCPELIFILMTIDNVQKAINKLEAIDPKEEYAYEKAVLAYLTIKHLPILLYDIPHGTFVFRTRTHETDNLFPNISDISITPNSFVMNFARCNRPFQSKFYCSENRPTSYMELVEYWAETKEFGDKIYVTIGKWRLKRAMTVIIVTTPDSDKRISDFDIQHGAALESFIEDTKPEIREATIILYRYLFDKFSKSAKKDPKTYIITTAYCNLALSHADGKADGFYYPSVPFGGQGVNFAINAGFMEGHNMELTNVLRNEFNVDRNESGKHSFTESDKIEAKNVDMSKNAIGW